MSLTALALVVVAALLHASWNILAKQTGGNRHVVLIAGVGIVVLWAPVAAWVGFDDLARWGWLQWGFVGASGLLHLMYFNVLLKGYRVSDLTVVYPVARGTGPLISSVLAVLVFGESLGVHGVLGVLGICTGVFVVAGGPALLRAAHDPAQRARVRAGIAWGTATGVFIAAYTVLDGYSVKRLAIGPILLDYFGNLIRLPFMLPAAARDWDGVRDAWRRYWVHGLVLAAISPLAYMLVLYAIRIAPVSHVAPAREISMLFAALIGGRLLGEGERGLRVFGAVLMGVGVALLAL
jgi:drug/metabolite transporter (DMT)-like permease